MIEKMYEQLPDHEYTATANPARPGMTNEVAPCPPPLAITLRDIENTQKKTLEILDKMSAFLGEANSGAADPIPKVGNFGEALRAAAFWDNVIEGKVFQLAATLGVEL